MADNVGYTPGTGATVAADDIGGILYQRVKIGVGDDGTAADVSLTNPMPVAVQNFPASQVVTGPLTDAELRASALPISGTVTANTGLTQPLTDTQLRASAVPVSGTVTANTGLTQPLTDAQLRASAVPVSGTVTANIGISQPLTDAQLRASAVPVSIEGGASISINTVELENLSSATVRLLDSPRGFDKSLQRQRGTVIVESGTVTTVTTVTTVNTINNLVQIDGIQGKIAQNGTNLLAWANCVRSKIT